MGLCRSRFTKMKYQGAVFNSGEANLFSCIKYVQFSWIFKIQHLWLISAVNKKIKINPMFPMSLAAVFHSRCFFPLVLAKTFTQLHGKLNWYAGHSRLYWFELILKLISNQYKGKRNRGSSLCHFKEIVGKIGFWRISADESENFESKESEQGKNNIA